MSKNTSTTEIASFDHEHAYNGASLRSVGSLPKRTFTKFAAPRVELPDLVEPQRASYRWFVETCLKDIFKEFSPIADYSEKKFELKFKKYQMGQPK